MANYIRPAAEPWQRKKKQVQAENNARMVSINNKEIQQLAKAARAFCETLFR